MASTGRRLSIPTRTVARVQAANYLRKAEDHLAVAIEAVAAECWSTAVLLSVHAAISAADAACVATAGIRSVSQTHMDQVRLVRQLLLAMRRRRERRIISPRCWTARTPQSTRRVSSSEMTRTQL